MLLPGLPVAIELNAEKRGREKIGLLDQRSLKRTKAAAREGVDRQLATRKEAVNNPAKDKEKWPRASNAHGAHACKVTGVGERNEVVLTQLISVNWRETADPGVEARAFEKRASVLECAPKTTSRRKIVVPQPPFYSTAPSVNAQKESRRPLSLASSRRGREKIGLLDQRSLGLKLEVE